MAGGPWIPITDGLSDAIDPVFDAGGKYLYFLASTDAGPANQWFAQSNADMRVRLKAQFELVRRGDVTTLRLAARRAEQQLARIHGLWGIAQLARKDRQHSPLLTEFLADTDPEIRAQAARLIGDRSVGPWQAVRTWYNSAKWAMRCRCVRPPAWATAVRM